MAACLIDIDLGELPDEPEELYALAHLANVACGGHAGDEASMRAALERCVRHGAAAGAHPSFPDREGFGRRVLAMDPAALRREVERQCAVLAAAAAHAGTSIGHVKAHGALYHAADRDLALAVALLEGAATSLGQGVRVIGPPGGALSRAAAVLGLPFLREGFADRGLLPDGTLVPRGHPGALLVDATLARTQAVRLATSGSVDVLCVHGDGPAALSIARAVRAGLDALP